MRYSCSIERKKGNVLFIFDWHCRGQGKVDSVCEFVSEINRLVVDMSVAFNSSILWLYCYFGRLATGNYKQMTDSLYARVIDMRFPFDCRSTMW